MKLIRFGGPGKEKPGVLLNDGTRVDASGFGSDYDEAFFGNGGLAALRRWLEGSGSAAPRVAPSIRLAPPICRPSKIVCIGLNFRDHAAESGMEIPEEPVIFFKATTSLVGPNDPVVIPRNARRGDGGVDLPGFRGRRPAIRAEGARPRVRSGLRPPQRLLRAELSARARRPVGEGKERGHVRSPRAVSG